MDLPDFFIEKMYNNFPNEAEGYFKSFNQTAYQGIRANTLKITPEKLCGLMEINTERVKWCDEGFYYNQSIRPAKSPYYHAGLFYIQEPSAMSAASIFEVKPGDKVLDMCAAPGGKTTQLAAKLEGRGVIVANDASNTRCRALLKNIELMGITNAVILNETPEKLSAKFKGYFNKILIDAPCSGEGMFRKDPDAVKNYTKFKSEQLSAIQKSILFYADNMLMPGGEIMYSTCTFSPEEDEMVIGWFLETHKDYELIKIDEKYGFDNGNPWFYEPELPTLSNTARLWPHKIKGEGHFLARLKKNKLSNITEDDKKTVYKKLTAKRPKGIEPIEKFFVENLNISLSVNSIASHGESYYIIPDDVPELNGIRIIRMGFYLGDIRKNRFEPSQALAMSLKMEDAKRAVNFTYGDEGLYRYLRGESFEVKCQDGYCLVCVEGYPLGFGKVQNGRLKNKYLKSWIMN